MEQKPLAASSQSVNSTEIDFFQLCVTLWEQRLLILVIAGLVTLCGAAFTYLSPDKFKAEGRLYPSYDVGLPKLPYELTSQGDGAKTLKNHAFQLVQQYLVSGATANAVVEDPAVAAIIESAYPAYSVSETGRIFLGQVKVMPPNHRKNESYASVSLTWSNADEAVRLLDVWVGTAMGLARIELAKNYMSGVKRKLSNLEYLVQAKHGRAKEQIDYEISRLREARGVANLLRPANAMVSEGSLLLSEMPEYTNIRELRALYQVGVDALDIEIQALQVRREEQNVYISGLVELKEQMDLLVGIDVNKEDVQPAEKDINTSQKVKKISLNSKVIISVFCFLGAILGVIVALLVSVFRNSAQAKSID